MQKNIKMFDYSRKRNNKEIFLFYLACIIVGIFLLEAVKITFAAAIWGEDVPKYYYLYLGFTVAILYILFLLYRIFYTKNIWKNKKAILLAISSVIFCPLLGLAAALVPLSILLGFEPETQEQ